MRKFIVVEVEHFPKQETNKDFKAKLIRAIKRDDYSVFIRDAWE